MKYIRIIKQVFERFGCSFKRIEKIRGSRTILLYYSDFDVCFKDVVMDILTSINGLHLVSIDSVRNRLIFVY